MTVSFRNWAGNVRFVAERHVAPRTLSELKDVIKSSNRLRIVGKGHSFNHGLRCADTIVSLRHLRRVLAIDPERHTVEVYNHDSGNGQLLVQSVGQFQRGRRVDVTY